MIAAGAAAGVAVERQLIGRRSSQRAQLEAEPFGSLRGTPHVFTADDGVELYVEVDELKRSAARAAAEARFGKKLPLPPEDLTVIFAHGYGLNMDCWHFERRDLAGIGTMVFYDQRSHGRSGRSPKENVTIDQLGRDLYGILDGVRADRPGDPDRALDGRHVDHGAGRAAPGAVRRRGSSASGCARPAPAAWTRSRSCCPGCRAG